MGSWKARCLPACMRDAHQRIIAIIETGVYVSVCVVQRERKGDLAAPFLPFIAVVCTHPETTADKQARHDATTSIYLLKVCGDLGLFQACV